MPNLERWLLMAHGFLWRNDHPDVKRQILEAVKDYFDSPPRSDAFTWDERYQRIVTNPSAK